MTRSRHVQRAPEARCRSHLFAQSLTCRSLPFAQSVTCRSHPLVLWATRRMRQRGEASDDAVQLVQWKRRLLGCVEHGKDASLGDRERLRGGRRNDSACFNVGEEVEEVIERVGAIHIRIVSLCCALYLPVSPILSCRRRVRRGCQQLSLGFLADLTGSRWSFQSRGRYRESTPLSPWPPAAASESSAWPRVRSRRAP